MSTNTKIEWTDATWSPVIGCSKISDGCKNCYAERMANRLANNPSTRNAYSIVSRNGKWSGHTAMIESALEKPFKWKKPKMIFVCSMSDLFHESVPFEWIDKVMAVIGRNQQHVFQVLTKRPERMFEYFTQDRYQKILNASYILGSGKKLSSDQIGAGISNNTDLSWWPQLWLGVTAENQAMADKRIPILLEIPAKVRFVSVEPMLEEITFDSRYLDGWCNKHDYLNGGCVKANGRLDYKGCDLSKIDQVICGPETGPGARPCKKEWITSLYEQCKSAGVPFYDKKDILGLGIKEFPNIK